MQDILSISLPLVALVWLALREIAPRTSTKVDDRVVDALDAVGEKLGISAEDLRFRYASKKGRSKYARANRL